jgi:hypothetical protein
VTALAAAGVDPWDPPPLNLWRLLASLGTALTRAWWWVTDLPARVRPVPEGPSEPAQDLESGAPTPTRVAGRHAGPLDIRRELTEIRTLVAAGALDPSVLAAAGYWADPTDEADAIALTLTGGDVR